MKKKRIKLSSALIMIGALMVLSSIAFVIITASLEKTARESARSTADKMLSLMPEIKNAQTDDRVDASMASMNIGGTDFCAVIEVPRFGALLPVHNTWDKVIVRKYPCRFTGSVYDGTLVIGGADSRGQFDFIHSMTEGDAVLITDTEGLCYSYTVSAIELTDDASSETLTQKGADLVLFAQNTYGSGYTLVLCNK